MGAVIKGVNGLTTKKKNLAKRSQKDPRSKLSSLILKTTRSILKKKEIRINNVKENIK
jgi:hypothetical protein